MTETQEKIFKVKDLHMVSFDITKKDALLIDKIVERAMDEKTGLFTTIQDVTPDKLPISMDITAVHANGTKLKLQELLDAKQDDFMHDVIGMLNNLNRSTGKLENGFGPRHAA